MIINRLVLIFLASFSIFIFFLSPNVNTGDGGELVTTAHFLGVAHPSGYPLYLVIAKTFTFLPLGNMAFKVALSSALASSIVLTLIYWTMLRFTGSHSSAFFTVALLIQSYAFITQSVIIKFYPLNLLFVTLIFVLCSYLYHFTSAEISLKSNNYLAGDKLLLLIAFLFGLVSANHHTGVIIAAPLFLIWGINHFTRLKKSFFAQSSRTIRPDINCQNAIDSSRLSCLTHKAFLLFALFISGFLINSYILVRGKSGTYFSPTIWNSYKDLYEVFFRQAYGEGGTISAASSILSGLESYWFGAKNLYMVLTANFSVYSLPVFVLGCFYFVRINAAIFLFILTCLLLYGPFLARLTFGSAELSEINYYMAASQYFLPAFAFYAVFTGAGFYQITKWLKHLNLKLLSRTLPIILACFPLVFLMPRATDSNYRTDFVPYQAAKDSYSILPLNSVLLTFGDNATYQGWYLKLAGRYREDICQITASDQNTSRWAFQGCQRSVYGNTFSAFYSHDFKQMLPLILKGRLFATDPVKNDTRYADYMSSEVFSIIYIYLPRDYFNGGSKHHKDMVQFINSGQLMSEKLINYSACLSHFTDDLFTRQLCSSYVIHLTNMARYYSDDRYNKTGEKVKVQIRDIKTGYAQQLYTVNVTERNRPYLELSNHIAEFNKWKLLYLRRDE